METAPPDPLRGLARVRRVLGRARVLGRTALASVLGRRSAAGYIGWVREYSTHNIGDSAMLPIFSRELAPVRLFPSMLYRRVEHRVWSAACRRAFSGAILGGGTLIFSDHFYEYLARALDAGIPCYVLGTGVRSPEFWLGRRPEMIFSPERWVEALRACRFVGVRGPLSQLYLRQAGYEEAEIIGDPILLVSGGERTPRSEENILGVNFGTSAGMVWGGDEEKALNRLAGAVRELLAGGWRARLYCVWPKDRPMIGELKELVGSDGVSCFEEVLDAETFMKDVGGCAAFLGMKLHATALALCAGVPSLMLEYRPKCRDFMASLGLEALTIRLDEVEAASLAGRLRELPRRWRDVSSRSRERKETLKAALKEKMRMVRDDLISTEGGEGL